MAEARSRAGRWREILFGRASTLALAVTAIALGIVTFVLLAGGSPFGPTRPGQIVAMVLASAGVLLLLAASLASRLVRVWAERRRGSAGAKLHVRLVLLFGGVLQPLTIMSALPLSLGGALMALLLAQKALGISAVIGVLMLMGIVAKNSILLVEYAIEAERAGMARGVALMEAARKRARPIVMTTIAMTAGMAHIAAGVGADAEFRSPMALVVIGGLITSTLLSLVVVPVVYTLVDDAGLWVARRLHRPRPAPARA